MNKVILIGNLTRDPELSQTNSGVSLCRFGLAVNRTFANASGEKEVDFFNIVAWRELAETCNKFLRKGLKVAVCGRINIRSYEQDGVKKTSTDIVADEVEFLTPRDQASGYEPQQQNSPARKSVKDTQPITDDDLPF